MGVSMGWCQLLCVVVLLSACRTTQTTAWPEAKSCSDAIRLCHVISDPTDLSQVVCIDYTGPVPRKVARGGGTATDDSMLETNRNILVRVVHKSAKDELTVSLGGGPGETPIRVAPAASTDRRDQVIPSVFRKPAGECFVDEVPFAPRTPGVAVVTIERLDRKAKVALATKETITTTYTSATVDGPIPTDAVVAEKAERKRADVKEEGQLATRYSIELLVPQVYSGALRVGVSGLWGVGDHGYGRRPVQGMEGAFTVDDEGLAHWNMELVAAYVPYWQAFTRKRGRDAFRLYRWRSWANRLSPYLGIGVVSVSTRGETDVRFLRSLYLGGEYELFATCSVAVAAVVRRADRLAPNLAVNGPVSATEPLTRTELDAGLAVVLNFTPEFLDFVGKVATK